MQELFQIPEAVTHKNRPGKESTHALFKTNQNPQNLDALHTYP